MKLSFIILVLIFTNSCGTIIFKKDFKETKQRSVWLNNVYKASYFIHDNDKITYELYVDEDMNKTVIFGPPIVPIIPISFYSNNVPTKLDLSLRLYPKKSHDFDLEKLNIFINDSDESITPLDYQIEISESNAIYYDAIFPVRIVDIDSFKINIPGVSHVISVIDKGTTKYYPLYPIGSDLPLGH